MSLNISWFQDDKKFFQMELVNRETNFNKVFTSSPNVGVLDPRTKVGIVILNLYCTNKTLKSLVLCF